MSFLDIVSKFNRKADSHSKSQSLNPFSEQFEQSRSPSPRFSREEYGKPVAGSKTDMRGRKAKTHICREILELCTVIHDVGTYNAKKRDPDDDEQDDDGTIIVSFGELFQIYTKISDKVVGLLLAAKRRGFVYFDREILFQRRDDDVLIALLKPISEISKILKEDISQTNAPVVAVAAESTKPAVAEKNKSASAKTKKCKKPECNDERTTDDNNYCATTVDQTNNVNILEVNGGGGGGGAVDGVENGAENDETNHRNGDGGETVVGIVVSDVGGECPDNAEAAPDEAIKTMGSDGSENVDLTGGKEAGEVQDESVGSVDGEGVRVENENVDLTGGGEKADEQDQNDSVDSTDGEEVEEISKDVRDEKHRADVTNESINVDANGEETEHNIIFLSEN